MSKYNLYHFRQLFLICCINFIGLSYSTRSEAQLQFNVDNPAIYSEQIFQYLASQIALQRGEVGLSYQTLLSLARDKRDPRLAQQAMEIALTAQSPTSSLEAARLWDELTPASDKSSRQVLVTLLMINEKWNEAVTPTIDLLKKQSSKERNSFLNQILPMVSRANKQDDAMIAFAKILETVSPPPSNTNIQFIYALGEDKLGNYANSEKLLRSIIKSEPNNASALNALGYSYADRNVHLLEAKSLIERAIRLSPNDPFILDSLGWVYFRLGDTSNALIYLQDSFSKLPEAEVGAHLGEVLWSLGQPDDAEKVWRKAESINADHPTLKETLRRLRPDWAKPESFDETMQRQWDGRFAVKVNGRSTQNSGSGSFSLTHENLSDTLDIRSPLGTSIAKIHIKPSLATLEQNGKTIEAIDADTLVARTTGLPIPARGLSAWLSGFTRTGSPGTVSRNNAGKVQEIQQDGWLLKYEWNVQNQIKKLFMTRSSPNEDIEVRLIFDLVDE